MLVVDAYNVLHVTGVLPPELSGLEVNELADLVALSRWGRHQVALVCDGPKPRPAADERGAKAGRPGRGVLPVEARQAAPERTHHAGIRVEYAGGGASADAFIERLVTESSHPTRLTVVSNDRQVQRSAQRRRAGVMSADDWLRQLATDYARSPNRKAAPARRPHGPLSPAQVDAWLRYFGVEH